VKCSEFDRSTELGFVLLVKTRIRLRCNIYLEKSFKEWAKEVGEQLVWATILVQIEMCKE
jgi:hypothetical protein